MKGVYHVTCHECTFEGLYERRGVAADERGEHERDEGHRVSLLEIERPEPTTGSGPQTV
ncbi:hypothetical protein [Haloarcula litorea]|uniref:hypothetical protein n=1 Tax=Haloarcula litorea TaxID=3032579 RepID=UPI0023E828DA|nr:hypothetical protein [Halomicroarcula sp. GDY20]